MSLRTALPGNERNPEHVSSRNHPQHGVYFALNTKRSTRTSFCARKFVVVCLFSGDMLICPLPGSWGTGRFWVGMDRTMKQNEM